MSVLQHSIDRSLLSLVNDEVGARVLSRLTAPDISCLADELYRKDIYRAASVARRAIALMPACHDLEALAAAHLEHTLWCSWRMAQAATGTLIESEWHAEGEECLRETRNQPTIVVAPMTMPLVDVLSFLAKFFADRRVVVYGEGLPSDGWAMRHRDLSILGNASVQSSRSILQMLQRGGVFCTYPDFVYSGHACVEGALFGMPRLYSSAFLSFCARPGVHVLPLLLSREVDSMRAQFYDPIVFASPDAAAKSGTRMLILQIVARLLEASISQKPEQWLLLGTLAAEVCRTLPGSAAPAAEDCSPAGSSLQ